MLSLSRYRFLKTVNNLFVAVPSKHRKGFTYDCFITNSHRLYIQSSVIASLEVLMIVGSLVARKFLGKALNPTYYIMYCILLILMVLSCSIFKNLQKVSNLPSSSFLRYLPLIHTGVVLMWSAGITLLDQETYGQIIVYTAGLLITAVLTYTPPNLLLCMYSLVHVAFCLLLPLYQKSLWAAAGHFANSTIMAVTAWCIGRALYKAKLKDYMSFNRLQQLNRKLEYLSYYDDLTAIPNRRMFVDYIEEYWNISIVKKTPISLLFVDVDSFKEFNDLYGHIAGDNCLKTIAATLSKCLTKPTDFTSRYGGEEFIVLLPQTDTSRAIEIAHKIRNKIQALRILHEGRKAHGIVTVSIGIACIIPTEGLDYMEFVAAADSALYHSKCAGRNAISITDLEEGNLKEVASACVNTNNLTS